MRMARLSIEILDDAAGKPYVLIEGWPQPDDLPVANAPGMKLAMWADEVTVEDSRKEKP